MDLLGACCEIRVGLLWIWCFWRVFRTLSGLVATDIVSFLGVVLGWLERYPVSLLEANWWHRCGVLFLRVLISLGYRVVFFLSSW